MIDPNEAPEGYYATEVNDNCSGCSFYGPQMHDACYHCSPAERKDGESVIFIKKQVSERAVELVLAPDFLKAGIKHMEDRAATYDAEGERSMAKTVAMFNAATGHSVSEEQGWLFMICLKAVRTQQGEFRADNYEDGAAYFGLMGECGGKR